MVVGEENAPTYNSANQNYWIAGSRLTCPYLTNTAVAIVGEYYSDKLAPVFESAPPLTTAFITSALDSPWDGTTKFPPQSKHVTDSRVKGNYLFLDGHVEWVERLATSPGDPNTLLVAQTRQMFPPIPNRQQNAPNPFIPCP
jgi:prepilin-type processing-associated H-X9-DG protein